MNSLIIDRTITILGVVYSHSYLVYTVINATTLHTIWLNSIAPCEGSLSRLRALWRSVTANGNINHMSIYNESRALQCLRLHVNPPGHANCVRLRIKRWQQKTYPDYRRENPEGRRGAISGQTRACLHPIAVFLHPNVPRTTPRALSFAILHRISVWNFPHFHVSLDFMFGNVL